EPYYEEALRRDPGDSRCNNAMGLLLVRRGKFADAEPYFRKAVKRATLRNPNPYDGESYYNLGLCLKLQGKFDDAFDAFYKAVWNDAWQCAGYFELARIACRRGDLEEALELVERSLSRNTNHHKARHLKIALLRNMNRTNEALAEIETTLQADPIEFGALYEQKRISGESEFDALIRGYVHNYIEIALDYAHAGCFGDALDLLAEAPQNDPMVGYYAGWIETLRGQDGSSAFAKAQGASPKYCFPHRIECVPALTAAMEANPLDPRAPYYLGNFWFGHRRYDEGIECWERAVELDPGFPTAWRNLGLAYMNKRNDAAKSGEALGKAFALDQNDSRVFFELDQLRKKIGMAAEDRLAEMEKHMDVVLDRDDQTIELLSVFNLMGNHSLALEILGERTFHPWEGGEGKVAAQYVIALVELAKQAIEELRFDEAIELLQRSRFYPHNLGEGKLAGAQENNILYYLGCAFEGNGDADAAKRFFEEATQGLSVPTSAMYYNDQPPETILYQGLAHRKLGRDAEAEAVFQKLIDYGDAHINDDVQMDYFAVSLPDFLVFDVDLTEQNKIHCQYMRGLGELGMERGAQAEALFGAVLEIAPFHVGAHLHKAMLSSLGEPV
ncbi:tetratricopeptide repeat protein, partial [Pontiella sp.]|uniref:tetratricopeptide repeat protein n=1 Tax=Pontiella sp. TaxID=2837462 RepID=UPI00356929BA